MTDTEKLTRIGEACAEAFGTTYADIAANSKHTEPMQARIVAMWIAYQLMPHYPKKYIAQALGRTQGEAVGDAIRKVTMLRARHFAFREKTDRLYAALEIEVGITKAPIKTLQRMDAAIPPNSTNEINWGFSGAHSSTRDYFQYQNEKFSKAMAQAGFRQYVVGPE